MDRNDGRRKQCNAIREIEFHVHSLIDTAFGSAISDFKSTPERERPLFLFSLWAVDSRLTFASVCPSSQPASQPASHPSIHPSSTHIYICSGGERDMYKYIYIYVERERSKVVSVAASPRQTLPVGKRPCSPFLLVAFIPCRPKQQGESAIKAKALSLSLSLSARLATG